MMRSAGSIIVRASSGSRSSINSVEPLRSANSAVTVLRSPSGTDPALTEEPAADTGKSALPQSPQKRFESGLSDPHFAQRILPPQFEKVERRILCFEFLQQRLGVYQIGGVEAFGEPVVDFS